MCRKCGFELSSGRGGYLYVLDDYGNRVMCPHPGEELTLKEVLGENPPLEVFEARRGFNAHSVCLNCLEKFDMDPDWDERICSRCGSTDIKTARELVGKPCPRCKEGIFEEINTGLMT